MVPDMTRKEQEFKRQLKAGKQRPLVAQFKLFQNMLPA